MFLIAMLAIILATWSVPKVVFVITISICLLLILCTIIAIDNI